MKLTFFCAKSRYVGVGINDVCVCVCVCVCDSVKLSRARTGQLTSKLIRNDKCARVQFASDNFRSMFVVLMFVI